MGENTHASPFAHPHPALGILGAFFIKHMFGRNIPGWAMMRARVPIGPALSGAIGIFHRSTMVNHSG
jgi:hypothetical protein